MYKILANTEFPGKRVIYLPSCHSTNDESAKMLENDAISHGDIVITDNQTKGRGMAGNIWETEPGQNLTFSMVWFPENLKAIDQFYLNIAVSLSIIEVLNQLGIKALIKWPNDIFVNKNKIAGILISNSIRGSVISDSIIGIGLNVNQRLFKFEATSLTAITGRNYILNNIFNSIISSLANNLINIHQKDRLKRFYYKKLLGYKEERPFRDNLLKKEFTGKITGVDERGKLIILHGEGTSYYNFKEVTFLY